MTTTTNNLGTVTFEPGDRVRVTTIDGLVQTDSLYVGALGTVDLSPNSHGVYVYVWLDRDTRASGLLPWRLEHVEPEVCPFVALGEQVANLQYAAAVDMVETTSLGHYIRCQGQIEALDAVLQLIEQIHG